MRKRLLFFYFMSVLFVLCSCGRMNPVSLEQVKSDIESSAVFASLNTEIEQFEEIKRQTNPSDKEDIVYVCVKGENNDYSIVRNYKIKYVLYNDGWLLETIDSFSDSKHYDSTLPKHGVPLERVQEVIDGYFGETSEEQLHTWDEFSSFGTAAMVRGDQGFYENNSSDYESGFQLFEHRLRTCYVGITEVIDIPIEFVFSDCGDKGWDWIPTIGVPEKSVRLNEYIEGTWRRIPSDKWEHNHADITIDISNSDDETCYVDFFCDIRGDTFSTSGMMSFTHEVDEFGNIAAMELRWDDGGDHGEVDALNIGFNPYSALWYLELYINDGWCSATKVHW